MNSNKKYEDLTGMSMKDFGIPDSRWKVIKRAADRVDKKGTHLRVWLCECSCEQQVVGSSRMVILLWVRLLELMKFVNSF